MKINVAELRLWGKNPRYTESKEVDFKNIGSEDFVFRSIDKSINDNYINNLEKYYLNLFKNKKQKAKMFELMESLSTGFNENIDEILVTRSEYLDKNIDNYLIKENLYYVLEGNRRITSIHLLLNINNSRKIIDPVLDVKEKSKYQLLYEKFDNGDIDLNEINVKFFDTKNTLDEEIWKTLNTRHFGNRKGKMNWPRGLVLEFINTKVMKLREELKLNPNDYMNEEDYNKMKIRLESFTGKTISSFDLQSALLVTNLVNIFNRKNLSDKILFNSTDEDGSEKDDNQIIDSISEIEEEKVESFFSVSALELAFNTIKLLNNAGVYETLAKLINLNLDLNRWSISTDLDWEVFEELVCYVIKLIKYKKLNTRKILPEYIGEIKAIISVESAIEIYSKISKDIKKIKFENITFDLLSKPYDYLIDKIEFSEDLGTMNFQKESLKLIYNNIIPVYIEILNKQNIANKYLLKTKDKYKYALIKIWEVELLSLIKNNNNNLVAEVPLIVFSAVLRITSELILNWILETCFVNQHEITDYITLHVKRNQGKKFYLKKVIKDIFNHFNEKGESWNIHINNVLKNSKEDCLTVKVNYKVIFCLENNKNEFIFNEKKEIEKFLRIILKENFDENISEEISKFVYEMINTTNNEGIIDIINELIHKPQNIYEMIANIQNYEMITEKLKSLTSSILRFINLLLNLHND